MFATAMVASELTVRIADNARTSAENAFGRACSSRRTSSCSKPMDADARARVAMSQLVKLLKLDVVFSREG